MPAISRGGTKPPPETPSPAPSWCCGLPMWFLSHPAQPWHPGGLAPPLLLCLAVHTPWVLSQPDQTLPPGNPQKLVCCGAGIQLWALAGSVSTTMPQPTGWLHFGPGLGPVVHHQPPWPAGQACPVTVARSQGSRKAGPGPPCRGTTTRPGRSCGYLGRSRGCRPPPASPLAPDPPSPRGLLGTWGAVVVSAENWHLQKGKPLGSSEPLGTCRPPTPPCGWERH